MKNIKVNYIDKKGKRTSTTINSTIANFYYKTVLKLAISENHQDTLSKIMQDYVRENELKTKEDIEFSLLVKIYEEGQKTNLTLF